MHTIFFIQIKQNYFADIVPYDNMNVGTVKQRKNMNKGYGILVIVIKIVFFL